MTKPLVTNTTNVAQIKRAEQKIKSEEQTSQSDLRKLLKLPEFRRYVWELLSSSHIYKLSFDNSGSITAFNEGRRSIGLKILTEILEASPDSYIEMQKENKGDE